MKEILLVAVGGALGSLARYQLSGLVLHQLVDWKFPAGTFVVNVLGCLFAGVVLGLVEKYEWLSPDARIFLLTGLAGGFTTFSAFGVETMFLVRRGETLVAASYVAASVAFGLAALWIGLAAVRR